MPFRPRVIQPDMPPTDEYGDLQLPADLALLAEQLQLDAEYLAGTFPPDPLYDVECAASVRPTVRRQRKVIRRRRSLLIGTLASLLIVAVTAPLAVQHAKQRVNESAVATIAYSGDAEPSVPPSPTHSTEPSSHATVHDGGTPFSRNARIESVPMPFKYIVLGVFDERGRMFRFRGNEPPVSRAGHLRDAELDLLELEVTTPIFIEL